MSGAEQLGVGIVGLGFGARVHLPGWRLVEGARVVAACARHGAEEFARAAGVPHAYADWRELVADPEVAVVSVATPPSSHHEIALGALRAGKAVLCEKPLATSEPDAEELALAAQRPTAVNFSYRALPAFRLARERIEAGDLGRVLEAEVDWRAGSRLAPALSWSWKDLLEEGGGALAAYGVHALDYVEWLLGLAERLSGRLDRAVDECGGDPVTSDDACSVRLELASGAEASIAVSLVSPEPLHRVVVRGERGVLVLENRDPADTVRPFSLRLDGRELPVLPAPYRAPEGADPRVEPFAVHAAALAAAVRGGPPASPSFADGLRTQRLLEAVRRSAAEGRWVICPP